MSTAGTNATPSTTASTAQIAPVGSGEVGDEAVERRAEGDRGADEGDREAGRGADALGACRLGDHRHPQPLVADQGQARDDRDDDDGDGRSGNI
jgi:hypothetical protein